MFGALLGILWSIAVAIRHVWIQHLPPDQVPSWSWVGLLDGHAADCPSVEEVFKGSGR